LSVFASVPKFSAKLRAGEVLREMIELADAGAPTRPDFISYSTVINAWAQQGHPERASEILRVMYEAYVAGNETAKPDINCFNTVLAAYINCKDEDAPRRAEEFLIHMKKIKADGVLDIRPDVYTISSGTSTECSRLVFEFPRSQLLILTAFVFF
jgi:pentatricopeptide repeat protein